MELKERSPVVLSGLRIYGCIFLAMWFLLLSLIDIKQMEGAWLKVVSLWFFSNAFVIKIKQSWEWPAFTSQSAVEKKHAAEMTHRYDNFVVQICLLCNFCNTINWMNWINIQILFANNCCSKMKEYISDDYTPRNLCSCVPVRPLRKIFFESHIG